MKDLPPSQRPKTRYVKFKIHSETYFELGDVVNTIWENATDYMGVEGVSKSDMWIMGNEYESSEGCGVVRVKKSVLDSFISSLLFVDEINDKSCFIEVVSVSGSLKKL